MEQLMTVIDEGSTLIVHVSPEAALLNREQGEQKIGESGYFYRTPSNPDFIGPFIDEREVFEAATQAEMDVLEDIRIAA